MYLDRKTKCKPDALFDVPHKDTPMTAKRIMRKFPEFAMEMDGAGEERCLSYFWKRNKETKVYEFLDMEAEEEIAEIWGVEVYDEEKEKQKEKAKQRALTEDEIRQFKEELAYASQQVRQFLNNTTKTSSVSQQEPDSEPLDSESE